MNPSVHIWNNIPVRFAESDHMIVRDICICADAYDPDVQGLSAGDEEWIIRAGTVMSCNADTGNFQPVCRTTLDEDEAALQTTLSVTSTTPFRPGVNVYICHAGDLQLTYVEDLGAVTAIVPGVSITVTNALTDDFLTGDFVWVDTGECEGVARGILMDDVDLKAGICNRANAVATGAMMVHGYVNDKDVYPYDQFVWFNLDFGGHILFTGCGCDALNFSKDFTPQT
jgi:hypothetical protein